MAAGLELPKLTPNEGAAFLQARAKLNNPSVGDLSAAAQIAQEFDGMPLGLEQAGAYIEETQLSPGEYLELYKREGETLRNRSSEIADHPTVTVTFSLAVSKLSESAKQIVQQAAFFAPDAIPEELFAQGDGLDMQFRDAMADAIRSSLIHRNPSTTTVDIHRVVQAVVKDGMDDTTKRAWIAATANRLNELRERWLNPASLVERYREVVEGYPDRFIALGEAASHELKKRTLTDLYNQRPTWLDQAHRDLDVAVAEAYGWSADISTEEALKRLLGLNLSRST